MSLKENHEPHLGGGRVWTEEVLEDDFLQPFGSKLSFRLELKGVRQWLEDRAASSKQQV